MIYRLGLSASTDVTFKVRPALSAVTASFFRGSFYDFKGVRWDCEHRHPSEAEALACGQVLLDAFRRKHRSWRNRHAESGRSQ